MSRMKDEKLNDLQMQLVELIVKRWSVNMNISQQAFKSKSTFESGFRDLMVRYMLE